MDEVRASIEKIVKHILDNDRWREPQPAVFIEYTDEDNELLKIQTEIRIALKDGEFTKTIVLDNVPRVTNDTDELEFRSPLTKGVEGVVFFTKLGLDKWLENGGEQYEDIRTIGSSCFFIPRLTNGNKNKKRKNLYKDCVYWKYGNTLFLFSKDKGVKLVGNNIDILENKEKVETQIIVLTDKITQLTEQINKLAGAIKGGSVGGIPLSTATVGAEVETAIKTITQDITQVKNELNSLKQETNNSRFKE